MKLTERKLQKLSIAKLEGRFNEVCEKYGLSNYRTMRLRMIVMEYEKDYDRKQKERVNNRCKASNN